MTMLKEYGLPTPGLQIIQFGFLGLKAGQQGADYECEKAENMIFILMCAKIMGSS